MRLRHNVGLIMFSLAGLITMRPAHASCISDSIADCQAWAAVWASEGYSCSGMHTELLCIGGVDLWGRMQPRVSGPGCEGGTCAASAACEATIPSGCGGIEPPPPLVQIDKSFCQKGSIIQMENRAVGESIPVVGTPFSLVYFSDRVVGRTGDYALSISLAGSTIPSALTAQTVTLKDSTGQTLFTQSNTAGSLSPNQATSFSVGSGSMSGPGSIPLSFSYTRDYSLTGSDLATWQAAFGGMLPASVPSQVMEVRVGGYRPLNWGTGAWTFSVHHYYDAGGKRLYLGDGSSRKATSSDIQFDGDSNTYRGVASEDGKELYVFDGSGRHVRTRNLITGKVLYSFSYGAFSRLTSIVDAYGNTTTILRDTSGAMTGIQAPHGQVTTATLDANGYLASITNPNSETHSMTYTSDGLLLTFEKPGGQISTLTYNSVGFLTSDTSSAGPSATLSAFSTGPIDGLSGNAKLFSSTSEEGRVMTYGFQSDQTGNISSSLVRPDGSRYTRVSYNDSYDWVQLFANSAASSVASYQSYDSWLGDIGKYVGSRSVSLGGDAWGEQRTKAVIAGTASSHELSTPAIFQFTSMSFDTSINGNIWKEEFLSSTRRTTVTSPEGRKGYITTDLYGKPTNTQWATFTPTEYSYDTLGRLLQIDQGSRQSTLAYNSDGYLSSITNPASQTISFGYDDAGRVVSRTLPDSRVVSFMYDLNGNLTSITPPGKPAHGFIRNLLDFVASYIPAFLGGATSTPTEYTYNSDEQLVEIERPDGSVVGFNYDSAGGHLLSVTVPSGSYSFVSQGGLISDATSPDGFQNYHSYTGHLLTYEYLNDVNTTTAIGNVGRTYNSDFNITSFSIQPGSGSPDSVSYLYDTDALLTQAGGIVLTRSTSSGLITGTTLDRISDVYSYSTNYPEVSTYTAQYNPTSGSPTVLISENYTRDSLGRIASKTEIVNGTTHSYVYTYDSSGRLTDVTRDGVAYSDYTYDSNSNRTAGTVAGVSFSGSYDEQDRLTAYNTETFTYNLNGELVGRVDSATSQSVGYSHDAFGNLKQVILPSKTLNYKLDAFNRRVAKLNGSVVEEYYLYEDDIRVAAILDSTKQLTHRFVYGSKSSVPDYMIRLGTTYRLLSDERGSIRLVVNASTGAVSQQIDYDEYGRVIGDTNPGFQPFGFAGCLYDNDTKLCHFGAREYDASIGRWLTKDPILFAGGDTNLYGYVLNDPINLIDPKGLSASAASDGTGYAPSEEYGAITPTVSPVDAVAGGLGYAAGRATIGVASAVGEGTMLALANAFRPGSFLNSGPNMRIGFRNFNGRNVFRVAGDWVPRSIWKDGHIVLKDFGPAAGNACKLKP